MTKERIRVNWSDPFWQGKPAPRAALEFLSTLGTHFTNVGHELTDAQWTAWRQLAKVRAVEGIISSRYSDASGQQAVEYFRVSGDYIPEMPDDPCICLDYPNETDLAQVRLTQRGEQWKEHLKAESEDPRMIRAAVLSLVFESAATPGRVSRTWLRTDSTEEAQVDAVGERQNGITRHPVQKEQRDGSIREHVAESPKSLVNAGRIRMRSADRRPRHDAISEIAEILRGIGVPVPELNGELTKMDDKWCLEQIPALDRESGKWATQVNVARQGRLLKLGLSTDTPLGSKEANRAVNALKGCRRSRDALLRDESGSVGIDREGRVFRADADDRKAIWYLKSTYSGKPV